jgi:hypothetical protein
MLLTAKIALRVLMALLKKMGVQANKKVQEVIQTPFLLRVENSLAGGPPSVDLQQNRRLEMALDSRQEASTHLRPQDDPGAALCRNKMAFMQSNTSRNSLIVT